MVVLHDTTVLASFAAEQMWNCGLEHQSINGFLNINTHETYIDFPEKMNAQSDETFQEVDCAAS